MEYDYSARLYFEDEAPRIGSGWRNVLVIERERYVTLICANTGKRQRLNVDIFDRVEGSPRNSG